MKSVLISVQPYWVFLIVAKTMGWHIDKEKKIEVRKSQPKDENWDKVVKIYCSKDRKSFAKIPKKYEPFMEQFLGKVIGEFVCGKIDRIAHCGTRNNDICLRLVNKNLICKELDYEYLDKCKLSYSDIERYSNGYDVYGWHISNLAIYDEPRKLGEFIRICPEWEKGEITEKCLECEHLYRSPIENLIDCDYEGEIPITRPPQSWCYIESEVEGE